MSPNVRKYSAEGCDDLRRRINKLTVRVLLALHKNLDRPLLKAMQDSRPLARDKTHSRLKAITSSSSHPTPTPPPPTAILHTDFGPAPYRPTPPPRHPPPNIPLPPLPTSTSSLRLVTIPLPENRGTAACIEAGNMAADTIDALPRRYRRTALLVFDRRHPPNERIAAPPPPPPPPPHVGRALVVQRNKSAAMRKRGRHRPTLAVVPEE